jgi:hypothetical protein
MKNAESRAKNATSRKQPTKQAASGSARRSVPLSDEQRLREAVAPYINMRRLQYLAAWNPDDLRSALLVDPPPVEIQALLKMLSVVLHPFPPEPIGNPSDVAALLMVEMGALAQEQLRVICLNSKGCIQTIETVYRGCRNAMYVRPIELFREAMRRNSAAIILAHNHPSGDPTPSAEDLSITEQAIDIGKLLDIKVLDHVIIGRGQWISLREALALEE